MTGRSYWRRGWFNPVLMLEETWLELSWPIGHSRQAEWVWRTRWRRVTNGDVSWMPLVPETTLKIPMPAGAKPPSSAPDGR